MAKRIDKEIWREFIEKFSSYGGTLTQYCIENNLSKLGLFESHKMGGQGISILTKIITNIFLLKFTYYF